MKEKLFDQEVRMLWSLNYGEYRIKEAIDTALKWRKYKLLEGIRDPHVAFVVSQLLENQRIFNESTDDEGRCKSDSKKGADEFTVWGSAWKRCSIPVVRRIFEEGYFIGHDLVSVQAMNAPCGNLHWIDTEGRNVVEEVPAKTRFLKTRWQYNWDFSKCPIALDYECELTAGYAQDIATELNREILGDLRRNHASKMGWQYDGPDKLVKVIGKMSDSIAAKTNGREATWLVARQEVVDILRKTAGFEPYRDVRNGINWDLRNIRSEYSVQMPIFKIGVLNGKWLVFEEPLMPGDCILMGHKGNHYSSPYIFAPYMPLSYTKPWAIPDWWPTWSHSHGATFFRYAKRLMSDGANYYGSIKVDCVPEKETV